MLDKHLAPNLVALALILASLALDDPLRAVLLSTGLFALSGALTNWLAIHMLFERVPGLYGSGVIALHFEEFKVGIIRMVREQLLDPERVASLLARQRTPVAAGDGAGTGTPGGATAGAPGSPPGDPGAGASNAPTIDLEPIVERIDLDAAFDQLVATIKESSFGSMLGMVGGEAALQPLREPFRKRMRRFLADAARSPRLQAAIGAQISGMTSGERFAEKLDTLLRARLDELTPEMVRDIVQQMIRRHLGWLVVWGGVFGGLDRAAGGAVRALPPLTRRPAAL